MPGVGDRGPRQLSRQTLAEVIEPRVEELYSLVQRELRSSGYEELLSSGVVVTGGSAVMQGMVELGEEVFHMPVRLGVPRYLGGAGRGGVAARATPPASGCCSPVSSSIGTIELVKMQTGSFQHVFERMKSWVTGNF